MLPTVEMIYNSMPQNLTVCYFGTYRANYARNQILIAGLRAAGATVIECQVPLWKSVEDRVQVVQGGWVSFSFVRRVFSTYMKLLAKYFSLKTDYDVMVLGYPGQIDVFLARFLTKLRHKPLVVDMLMSIYLVALERDLLEAYPLTGRMIKTIEKWGSTLPNLLVFNTNAYIEWYQNIHDCSLDNVCLVPMGVDDRVFQPLPAPSRSNDVLTVLYYGTYIRNHGVEYIIEAANLLKHRKDIHFELVGDGPTRQAMEALAEHYQLKNITFTNWVYKEDLPDKIAAADVCLGVFSETVQSMMTIHNKIYEGLAMKKPVVTGDSPTIRETFEHGKHLYLVERANPQALAEGVTTLRDKPELRTYLAEEGYRKVTNEFTIDALGRCFKQFLERVTTNADVKDYNYHRHNS